MAFGDLNSAFMGTQINPLIARALLGQQPQGGGMPPGMASPYMGQAGQSVDPRLMGQVPPSIIQALGGRGNVAQNPDMPAQNAAPAGPAPLVHTAGGGFGIEGSESPDSIARKRKLAEALMTRGMDSSPIQSWTQGAARLAQAASGAYMGSQLDKREKEQDTARREMLLRAFGMGGSAPTSAPAPAPGQADTSAAGANSLEAAKRAIAKVESDGSGGYSAMGQATKSGDRAYGKYQVMGANIPQWTQEALGQRMTPQQFLANPQAQEKVFEHRFGGYLQRYGNMQDAASMWFSGKPFAGNNRSDGYNSVPQYVGKVLAAAGQGGGTPQQQPAQAPAAGGGLNPLIIAALTSNDPKFQQQAMAIAQFQAQQNKPITLNPGQVVGTMTPGGFRETYRAPDKDDRTNDQKNYEAAVKGGLKDSFWDYQTGLRRAGSAQPETTFGTEMAKGQAKQFTEMAGEYAGARSDISNVKMLREQMDKLPGGFLGNAQAMAVRMGIKVGPNASAVEAADAILNRLTPAQRQGMPGAASDRDVAMFRGALPQLGQTKEGQRTIMDTMESLATYKLQQAEIAQQVAMGRMKPEQAMERLAALPDPLANFKAMQGRQTPPAASSQTQQQGGPVRVNSPAEAAKLPKGTRFVDPNGIERIVP